MGVIAGFPVSRPPVHAERIFGPIVPAPAARSAILGDVEQWQPGHVLAGLAHRYTVDEVIASGGFGLAYGGRRSDGHPVVLKVLHPGRLREWKALELFAREAATLASLQHPQVPRYHDFFATDGTRAFDPEQLHESDQVLALVLVQDRIAGVSLQRHIDDGTRLDTDTVISILRALLGILDDLHRHHPPVVHRDIKPANVILGPENVPYLVDFGAIQDSIRMGSGGSTTVGTFGFVAMEQLMGKARPASDLYALGMTMLAVLTHRSPEALPVDESTGKIELAEVVSGIPDPLMRALGGMIEPIVGKRIQSAREVVAILDGETLPAVQGPRAPVRPDRLGWLWTAAIGLGGVAAGVIYLVMFDSFSETELIQISPLWLAPVAFGIGGRRAATSGHTHPIGTGTLWAGIAVGLLIVFIYGIFPAL